MSNLICNNQRCRMQKVKGRVGDKHFCGGTFVPLVQVEAKVPMVHRTERSATGKGLLRDKKSK